MENIKKATKLINSPALHAIFTWARPVRWSVVGISAITVVSTLVSLALTLVTKALVDAATGGSADGLWLFGGLMVALYAVQRGLSVWSSFLNVRTSAKLQRHLQGMVTRSILGKEYASLKPYHSGELVNRVFSDVSVVKGGMMNLPNEDQGETLTSFDAIEMKNACFQYDDGVEDVLLDVTATIHRGDFVAMTGISGGGKTSLFQLLLGIYRPTSGEILFVDGGKAINACRGTRGLFA